MSGSIDFHDLDYIAQHRDFLKKSTWEEASEMFCKIQPEPLQLERFKDKQNKLVEELKPLLDEADARDKKISEIKALQEGEYQTLSEIAEFKSSLLSLLPEKFLDEGRHFLNNFITRHDDNNYFPGEGPEYNDFKAKAQKVLYAGKLNRFKEAFLQKSKEFKAFCPRFDVCADKKTVEEDILSFYGLAELQKQRDDLGQKINEVEQKQRELALLAGNERMALSKKLEHLKSYYDRKLYTPQDYSSVAFSPDKEEELAGFERASMTWQGLIRESKMRGIRFGEVSSILKDDLPIAAIFDKELNRILCNKNFCISEQILEVAQILLEKKQQPLGGDYNIKSRYQFELCRVAEQGTKLVVMADEFSSFLPSIKSRVIMMYPDEMSAYYSLGTAEKRYVNTFIKLLSSSKLRKRVADSVYEMLQESQKVVIDKKDKLSLRALSLGEIISPFVSRGAPLISEHPEMKIIFSKIPAADKQKLQSLANNDEDYSLADMDDM
ncbi:MAG: hypothetical protein IJ689_03825 [Alphaproteobacteria bacterium]|nr:hypothetical protein [Alphaproteobacteria bacterium]